MKAAGGYSLSLSAVKQALITGLISMLNGTFPSDNISTYGNGGSKPGAISFATDVGAGEEILKGKLFWS